jgi:putative membrane protein
MELRTMMNGYYGDMGWGGWLIMGLIVAAFWALVVLGVVALFRGTSIAANSGSSGIADSPGPAPLVTAPKSEPQSILDLRFARGEIDASEYQARTDALHDASAGRR